MRGQPINLPPLTNIEDICCSSLCITGQTSAFNKIQIIKSALKMILLIIEYYGTPNMTECAPFRFIT